MRTIIAAFLFVLLAASTGMSQETSSGTKVGIAVGIEPFHLLSSGSTLFSLAMTPMVFGVPIEMSGGTRLEPEVGVFRFSQEVGGTTRTSSFYRVGAGIFFPIKKGERTSMYFGPKVGLFLTSSSFESGTSTSETSETDFFISANLGGEYAVSNEFRVFGEAQLCYLSFGDPTYTPAPSTTTDRSQSMIFTSVLVGVRFYF